jgi:hypothetical protein
MTMKESQGQIFKYAGIYLEAPIVFHGQLCGAMSRPQIVTIAKLCRNRSKLRANFRGYQILTQNIVYQISMNNNIITK